MMGLHSATEDILCARLGCVDGKIRPSGDCRQRGLLAEQFHAACLSGGGRTALRTADDCWSYLDLLALSEAVAADLGSTDGFRAGDRVVVMVPNSAAYVAAFFGTLLAGGVVVPVPTDMEADRLRAIMDATQASHVLASPAVVARWNGRTSVEFAPVSQTRNPAGFDPVAEHRPVDADQLAAIFYTSGSSGCPKGVMLSHHNLISNAQSIQEYLNIDETDRALAVLPFPHAFGNSVLQSHLLARAELVLDGSPVFPESLVRALEEHGCTSFSAVPDVFRMLTERTSLGTRPIPRLRYLAVAGGALPHAVAWDIAERITPARFFVMYGQTEATARLAYVPPDELPTRPNSIGIGIPGVELQIVDEQEQPVTEGQVGEIRARGPNIMLGYWQDPEATKSVLRDGWLYTGDLGAMDEDGRVSIRGRRSALVKIAGYRVHPREIEDFVTAHLTVAQAVVVAFETEHAGARLALFVRPTLADAERLTSAAVLAVCRQHLPRHRIPDVVQIVQAFPLTPSMKTDRQRLKELAETLYSERVRAA